MNSLYNNINNLIEGFINLLYPARCIVCANVIIQREHTTLCRYCLRRIKINPSPHCKRCGKHLDANIIPPMCLHCRQADTYFNKAHSVFLYEGIIKELIHKLKYDKRVSISRTLSMLSIDFIKDNIPMKNIDYIVPVPIHRIRLLKREFNQSQLIAKDISRFFKKRLLDNALIRIKPTSAQASLTRKERFENLKDAFAVTDKKIFLNQNILLVDDVLTTGVTINEASRTLKDKGAKTVTALTIACGL